MQEISLSIILLGEEFSPTVFVRSVYMHVLAPPAPCPGPPHHIICFECSMAGRGLSSTQEVGRLETTAGDSGLVTYRPDGPVSRRCAHGVVTYTLCSVFAVRFFGVYTMALRRLYLVRSKWKDMHVDRMRVSGQSAVHKKWHELDSNSRCIRGK